jgi:hypothetical protein
MRILKQSPYMEGTWKAEITCQNCLSFLEIDIDDVIVTYTQPWSDQRDGTSYQGRYYAQFTCAFCESKLNYVHSLSQPYLEFIYNVRRYRKKHEG